MSHTNREHSDSRRNFRHDAWSPGRKSRLLPQGDVARRVPFFTAAVHHQGVSRLQRQSFRIGDVFQLPAVHRLLVGDARLATVFGDVQQNAAGHDPVLPLVNGTPRSAVHGDVLRRVPPVPHSIRVPGMTQGVQVGGGVAVKADSQVVDASACPFSPVMALHVVDSRERVVGSRGLSPNPPKDTDGRREDSGRGWVRELQGRWPGVLG